MAPRDYQNPALAAKTPLCVQICLQSIAFILERTKATSNRLHNLFIDPDTCIDCGHCVDECPVKAIFPSKMMSLQNGITTSSSTPITLPRKTESCGHSKGPGTPNAGAFFLQQARASPRIPARLSSYPCPFLPPAMKTHSVLFACSACLARAAWAQSTLPSTPREVHRQVAVKVLHCQPASKTSATAAKRFLREAQSAAKLNHPTVVTIYSVGAHGGGETVGRPYIAMEYVEGGSLAERIRKHKPLYWRDAVRVLRDAACAGLAAAHRKWGSCIAISSPRT